MNTRGRFVDLVAFLAALGTGTTLIAIGVNPESFAVIVVAIAGLYGVWRNFDQQDRHDGTPREHDDPKQT